MTLRAKKQRVITLPENAQRMGNRFTRWLGRSLLALVGWRMEGQFPNVKQLVVAAAPHTSNWDFVVAMFAVMGVGVKISYLMKKEAFFWPLRNLFFWLGGIPVDREASEETVDQISAWYQTHEHVWVVITPEGTRSKVDRWKTGFLRIAERVNVPVFLIAWDYPNKTIHLLKTWPLTGDHDADADAIRDYIAARFQGKHPKHQ